MNLGELAVHTVTTRPWSLAEAVDAYAARGFGGIGVWREHLPVEGPTLARTMIGDAGLTVTSLVRGGFFVSPDAVARSSAIDDTRRAIDEAQAIGAPVLVIVPGADVAVSGMEARQMVQDALAEVAPQAQEAGVRLGLEPLHPMFAGSRTCIATLETARAVVEAVAHPALGVVVDVYHVWWQQAFEAEVRRLAAQDALLSFHISDWVEPVGELLTSRAVMGDGCIPITELLETVREAGFAGLVEIEILNDAAWSREQGVWLDEVVAGCAHL